MCHLSKKSNYQTHGTGFKSSCPTIVAGGTITVGHRTKTDQLNHVTVQLFARSVSDVRSKKEVSVSRSKNKVQMLKGQVK